MAILSQIADDGTSIFELKKGIVLYTDHPPNSKEARLVYDLCLKFYGDRISSYRSTTRGSAIKEWNQTSKNIFENKELPNLRKKEHWGYIFSDDQRTNSWLFMFHGYRPSTETGRASFYRFEFDQYADTQILLEISKEIIRTIPFLSGYGGYFFQGRMTPMFSAASYDKIFMLSKRFWGIEVQNLDLTVKFMLDGFKCVNWLTFIGNKFKNEYHKHLELAKNNAYAFEESENGILFQADETPKLGDQNKKENLDGYVNLAKALLPLQIKKHDDFGGYRWNAENTLSWIRRFTHPDKWGGLL